MSNHLTRTYRTLTNILLKKPIPAFLPLSGGRAILLFFAFAFLPLSGGRGVALDTLQVTSPDPILESYRWTEYTRASGLAGQVRYIYEDRDGNAWFATNRGVQKYDGYRWTTYTTHDGLAHNGVNTITQTRDGVMWFGTQGGISRFDPSATPSTSSGSGQAEQTAWTTYTTEDGLPNNGIEFDGLYEARDGTLWAGTTNPSNPNEADGGIARFDPSRQTWHILQGPEDIPRPNTRSIRETSDGSMWFATHGQGILRYNNGQWTQYTEINGFKFTSIITITEVSDGALWFTCMQPSGLLRYKDGQWQTYTAHDGLPEQYMISLWQDAEGTLRATGSGKNGRLCRFENGTWKVYAQEETPHLQGIPVVCPQRNGTIWYWQHGAVRAYHLSV